MTPYYSDELVTLYHGDCTEVITSLARRSRGCGCGHPRELHATDPDSKCLAVIDPLGSPPRICGCSRYTRTRTPVAQIVVTSPPYNMGLVPGGNGRGMYRPGASNKAGRFREGYDGSHDDAMPQADYDAWQREVLALLWKVIPDDGAIFYNHRPRVEHGVLRDPLGNAFGIPIRQRIIWNRKTGIDVNLRAFCTRGEYVYFCPKPDLKLASHAVSGMGDVWDLGMEHGVKDHPAPFPLALPFRCIEATAARSVLDPFAGSGTTLLAATISGIRSIGIEKSERYCEIAAKRLDQGVLNFGESA